MTASNVTATLDILVVDDETNIRKTLSIGLESEGHRVVSVSNAHKPKQRIHDDESDRAPSFCLPTEPGKAVGRHGRTQYVNRIMCSCAHRLEMPAYFRPFSSSPR